MNERSTGFEDASRFTKRVFDDIGSGEIPRTLRRDLKETYEFYLAEDERRRLATMGRFSRSLYSTWYLVRGLFMKLTALRQALVVASVALVWIGMPDNSMQVMGGFIFLLFVLGLELKDKLLAKDELEAGRAVQLALMPSTTPQLAGWEIWLYSVPANDVGGDLIDHMTVSADDVTLTLGDVAGKGLPAALMAARLQATVRALVPLTDNPAHMARELNTIVCRDGLPSKFASLVHLELGTVSPVVRLVNAGHQPPVHIHSDGSRTLQKGGPAIGLTPLADYTVSELTMDMDDLLVVYSDGVTEARNELGRFYSDERFEKLVQYTHGLHADALGQRILGSVDDFVKTARKSDDLSLIVIRRTT